MVRTRSWDRPEERPHRFDTGHGQIRQAGHLVDDELTPEAEEASKAVQMSFIRHPGCRAMSAFLRTDDFDEVRDHLARLLADLMLECLPGFVRDSGGQVALLTGIGEQGEVLNPILRSVTIEGSERCFLRSGHMFIHFRNERVVVSASEPFHPGEKWIAIVVRSDTNPGDFFRRWEEYAKEHNFLRGQSFFADGEIIERPRRYTWGDILLPQATRRTIQLHVESFLHNRLLLRELGVKPRRGLILAGPPGTGKTLLGKVLADNLQASFIWVSPRHIGGPDSFADVLDIARFVSPTVLFLEDLDLFGEAREGRGRFALGELMNQLDGAIDNEDVVTIATTNRVEVVEKALRNRPGRFDRIVRFEAMDERCRRSMLGDLLSKAAISPEDMDYLIAASDGCTGAQIAELVNTIYMVSVDEEPCEGDNGSSRRVAVDRALLDTALEEIQTVQERMIGFSAA